MIRKILVAAASFVILGWVLGACSETEPVITQRDKSAETLAATPMPPTPTPIMVEVVDTVGNILDLYQSNEIAAEANYTGKWAEMTGKVDTIESKGDRIEVNLAAQKDLFVLVTLVCKMPKEQTNIAAQLRKGDIITVRGKILGVPGISNVVVEPCEVPQGGTGTQIGISPTPLQPTPVSQTDKVVEVVDTVGNILDLYQSNEIAAEANYTGKWAEMTGKVDTIESKGDRIEVNLAAQKDLFVLVTLVCKMPKEQTNIAAQLRKGDIITVRGKILGVPGISNVVVEPCEVLR